MTKLAWSHVFYLECLDFKDSSYNQLPGSPNHTWLYIRYTSRTADARHQENKRRKGIQSEQHL